MTSNNLECEMDFHDKIKKLSCFQRIKFRCRICKLQGMEDEDEGLPRDLNSNIHPYILKRTNLTRRTALPQKRGPLNA